MSKDHARTCRSAALLCGVALLAAHCATLHASTVVPMDLPTLSDHAGQVIVGRVTSLRSYWTTEPRRIETEVTLTDVEYLKGQRPEDGATFCLRIPGGTVGKLRMHVTDAPEFAVGERWLLFLLPAYRTHPVVGLEQGAFRIIEKRDGTTHVCTAHGKPIIDMDTRNMPQTASERNSVAQRRLVRAEGLRLRRPHTMGPPPQPLTLPEFRQHLEPILAESCRHVLNAPAGQPDIPQLRPIPMRVTIDRGARGGKRMDAARAAVERITPPARNGEATK